MYTALLLALLAGSPSPAPTPDPYRIYKVAMQHLATLPQPNYVDDSQEWSTVTFVNGQAIPGEHLQRTVFDSVHRRESILSMPFNPAQPVVVGDSYFAPDSWLIRRNIAVPRPNVPNMAPDLTDLPTIANVISVAEPSYEIRFAGIDPLTGGGSAYQLVLQPVFDPVKHNLRQLWINTANNNIMRAEIEGSYRPSMQDVVENTHVFEDFGAVGKYWLVIHHVWTYAPAFSNVKFQYSVMSLMMGFPSALPDWFSTRWSSSNMPARRLQF